MIWTFLQPKFKMISNEKGYENGQFHQAIADALNYYFKINLSKQIFTATGTVTAGVYVSPFSAPCVRLTMPDINMTGALVKSAFTMGGQTNALPELFKAIGNQMTLFVSGPWSGSPVINGVGYGSLITSHFYSMGIQLFNELSKNNPAKYDGEKDVPDDDVQRKNWDAIESKLTLAVNSIPVMPVMLAGGTAAGAFVGTVPVKLMF